MWLYSVGRASSRVPPVFCIGTSSLRKSMGFNECVSVLSAGDELDNDDGHVSCVQVRAK